MSKCTGCVLTVGCILTVTEMVTMGNFEVNTNVFTEAMSLQPFMAKGHTLYCGLVRGPHVEK
jgi:hypothetical protein